MQQGKNVLWYAERLQDYLIQTLQDTDSILDKLESRSPGDSGMFGSFFNDDDE